MANLQVHVYELTHQEDNHDLRYRLKDKIYLPAKTLTSPSDSASIKTPSSRAGESKEESKGAGSRGRGERSGSGDGGASGIGEGGSGDAAAGQSAFLLVTWNNVVLCEGKVLQLYEFSGVKVLLDK